MERKAMVAAIPTIINAPAPFFSFESFDFLSIKRTKERRETPIMAVARFAYIVQPFLVVKLGTYKHTLL